MIGLPIELEQDYQRNKTLKEFFAIPANVTKVNADPPMKGARDLFLTHFGEFEGILPGKDVITGGISDDKLAGKKIVANTYGPICRRTRSFARKIGDGDLKKQVNFTKSRILKMADGEVLGLATAINKVITDKCIPNALYAPYGIDAVRLTAALAKATVFNGLIGKAGSVTALTHAVIESLEAKNLQMHDDVLDMTDLMQDFQDVDNTLYDIDFYNAYQAAKVVHDIGVHHSGLKGHVLIGGQPAPDVSVECLQNAKKNTMTDLLGYFEEYNFRPGPVEFKFTKGALVYNLVVNMKRGEVVTLDIRLDEVNGSRGIAN
jgi:hypothetical protein